MVIHRFWGLPICDGSGQSQLADAKVKSLAREHLGRAGVAQSGVATLPAGGTLVGLGSAKLGCAGRGCVSELRSLPAVVVRPQGIKVGQARRADRPSTPCPPSAPVTDPALPPGRHVTSMVQHASDPGVRLVEYPRRVGWQRRGCWYLRLSW